MGAEPVVLTEPAEETVDDASETVCAGAGAEPSSAL
jgi:hypothetical protein